MPSISVIIPVLNELETLKRRIGLLHRLETKVAEVIFVDGGSQDGSLAFLQAHMNCVISAKTGRSYQMNAGATKASGDIVLFLHIDTVLPPSFPECLDIDLTSWGFFLVRLSGKYRLLRCVEKGINFRSRLFRVATGDQCLFFKRAHFLRDNGFKAIELMEDIDISRRFKKKAVPSIITDPVITSSRMWEKRGVIRTVFLMWSLQLLYCLGISDKKLHSLYYGDDSVRKK